MFATCQLVPAIFALLTTVVVCAANAADTAPSPAPVSLHGRCTVPPSAFSAVEDKFIVLADKQAILDAKVVAQIVIGPEGQIKSIRVVESSHPEINPLVIEATRRLQCRSDGHEVTANYPVEFHFGPES